jgi:type II secretory pathway pseudopilin PulG
MNPADMLCNVYQAFLLDFEEQSRHSQAAQAAKNQQQLQQQQQQNQQTQMPIATETLTTASTQSQQAPTEAKPQNVPQDQTKPSSAVAPVLTSDTNQHSLDATHKASTPKQTESTEDVKDSLKAVDHKQAPVPRPASRADSVSSQVGSTSSMPSSRAEGELLAQRQRMLLQAQTKAMLQGMPASAFPGPYGGSPGPSSAGPSVEKTSLNGSVPNGELRKQEGSEKQLSAGKVDRRLTSRRSTDS